MRMDGLARLHASMKQVGIERMRFRIQHNHLTFEGLFLADVTPFELALAALGHDLVLIFNVSRGYDISAYLGDMYGPLAAALGTGAGSGNALRSSDFLREIDAGLPKTARASDQPGYADVARVYRDVEDAHKVHFVRFMPHRGGNGNVTTHNLDKTRRLLGQHTHDWCRRNNVSTAWRDIPPAAPNPVALPNWTGYR